MRGLIEKDTVHPLYPCNKYLTKFMILQAGDSKIHSGDSYFPFTLNLNCIYFNYLVILLNPLSKITQWIEYFKTIIRNKVNVFKKTA